MGALVKVLVNACNEELDNIASSIQDEMKAVVSSRPYATGKAAGAVHTEVTGEWSRFVGGTGGEGTKHLYWLNEGNGNTRIVASGKALGKYPGGIPGIGWRKSVSPYKGIHFVEEIASHY